MAISTKCFLVQNIMLMMRKNTQLVPVKIQFAVSFCSSFYCQSEASPCSDFSLPQPSLRLSLLLLVRSSCAYCPRASNFPNSSLSPIRMPAHLSSIAFLIDNSGSTAATHVGAGSSDPALTGSAPAVVSIASAPTAAAAPTAELTSNSFVNAAMRHPGSPPPPLLANTEGLSSSGGSGVTHGPSGFSNVSLIVMGAVVMGSVLLLTVLGFVFYRRRKQFREQQALMFLEVGEKDIPIKRPAPALTSSQVSKGSRIGEPMLLNTTAGEALRGPGVISAGSRPKSPNPAKKPVSPKTTKKPKQKPTGLTLSTSMYKQSALGGPTIAAPSSATSLSPSPRYLDINSITDDYLMARTPTYAPSPRRQTSFDCAPSPLPTDSRQRYGRFQLGDQSPSVFAQPGARVVGHRRSRSSRTNSIHNRTAVYGQAALNRLSTASSQGGDSLLTIPMTSRASFEHHDVHGMI